MTDKKYFYASKGNQLCAYKLECLVHEYGPAYIWTGDELKKIYNEGVSKSRKKTQRQVGNLLRLFKEHMIFKNINRGEMRYVFIPKKPKERRRVRQ